MAERFHEHWFGPQQVQWTQQMRAALPNVRQALAYSLTTPGQEHVALRMAGRLDFFWSSCGVNQEGRLWLGRALAADHTPGPDRARALASYVRVLTSQSMHADAARAAQESVDLARRFDEALVPAALTGCGLNMVHLGQSSEGISLLDEAIARARSDADQPLVLVVALVYRCFVLTAEGRMADVAELLTECQSICRRHGDSAMLTYALTMSVPPLLESGEVVRAAALAGEALPLAAAMHDNLGLTLSFEMMAWCASAQGDHRRAACLFGAAALQVTMNGGSPFDVGPYHDARRPFETTSRSALGDAAFEAEARRGERMPLDQAVAYALTGDHRPVSADRPASPARAGKPVLTPREREVAELVAQGLTNKQIGARLFITHRTAEGHIENIFVKLGVTSRTQLAARLSQRAQPHDGTPPEPGADHGLG
jgi:non-specific serine/threonine protein kinase